MMWTLQHRRGDGTFVILAERGPYHVTHDDPLFEEVAKAAEGADLPPEPGPAVVVAAPVRIISPLAFRRRLGAARGALTVAAAQALAAGDPTLQVMLDDIAAAREIDLDDPELAAGIASVVALGLLTKAQGRAVLADVAP